MEGDAPKNRLLSIESTLTILDIGRTSLYALLDKGQLQAVKIGRRTFITSHNLDDFIARLPSYRPATQDGSLPVNHNIEKDESHAEMRAANAEIHSKSQTTEGPRTPV
jgi:hypothetical protein